MAKLTFFHGPMGAGKSEELLKVYRNYDRIGQQPIVYSFKDDNRFNDSNTFKVVSRNGDGIKATPFNKDTKFDGVAERNQQSILIDEAQFITEQQMYEIINLVDNYNVDVLCFGLRTDAFVTLFEGSRLLFECADKLVELKTLCAFCNRKAIMNARFVNGKQVYNGEQIQIGDQEYRGVCRKHYFSDLVLKEN